jgi:hypothetical protein
MRHHKLPKIFEWIFLLTVVTVLYQNSVSVSAAQEQAPSLLQTVSAEVRAEEQTADDDFWPPHLIQSVSEQDIYEGMLSLGFLESPVLETEDCQSAFENVKDCVVLIHMGNAYGSGLVWQLTEDEIVIATNAHVLAYWDDTDSFVWFSQGYYADAAVIGTSGQYDVGFLSVPRDQLAYEELESLHYVSADEAVYDGLEPGAQLFCVGAGSEAGDLEFHEGTVGDTWKYIDGFGNDMLYGHGFAKAGMSGGGTFDGYGHLIGMICGGTQQDETASVPLPSMIAAYKEITGDDISGEGI